MKVYECIHCQGRESFTPEELEKPPRIQKRVWPRCIYCNSAMYPEENIEKERQHREDLEKKAEEILLLTKKKMQETGLTRLEARKEVLEERKQASLLGKTRKLTAFGETKTYSEWVEDERCPLQKTHTIYSRIHKDWSPERAITQPVRKMNRRPR